MALVNPNIAMSYRPTTEYQPRNALAEYAQVQQIVGGQRQAEIADMQLEALRRKEQAMSQIQATAVKNGGPTDRREIAQAYIKSGVPDFVNFGLTMQKDLDELDAYAKIMGGARPASGAAAGAAPTSAAGAGPTAAPSTVTAPAAAAAAPAGAANMLAAQQGPAPAANVNQLAAADAASVNSIEALRTKRDQLIALGTPRALQAAKSLDADIALRSRTTTASPGSVVLGSDNRVLYTAPSAIGAIEAEVDALKKQGVLDTDPRIVTRQNKIRQLSGTPGPTEIAIVEAEVDALRKQGVADTDSRIANRLGKLRQLSGAPGPTDIATVEAEIAALEQQGVPSTDPRITSRRAKIGQLSGAGAPLDITRAMAQRDQLIAAGRPPTDPDVRALNDFIRKQTTHQPAAQQNVYAYTPASEVAQQDFMRGARATYDMLKNAPATLKNIDAAKELIPSSAGFMGPGGEPLLKVASFLNNRFGTGINTKGVTDATELRSRLFAGVIENLRKLDAQPTAAQQQTLQDAIGNLGTDPSALPRVLDAMAQSVRDKVELYNRDVTGAEQRGVRFPYKPQIELPPVKGAPGAAAGQIPAAGAPAGAAGNTVTLPNGTVMTFPSAEAAAKFKKDARLP